MRKLLVSIFLFTVSLGYSQQASKVNNGQNVYATGQPRVVLSCDTLPSGLFRLYPKDLVTWDYSQLTNKPTTLTGYGITDGVSNTDFTWTNLSGKPTFATVATSGSYLDLSNTPVIPTNNNQLTNGSNFINQAGARTAISLTTTGSGAATYNNSTGVLNIPNYTPSVRTYNNSPGRTTVTNASAANGFQISATKESNVSYSLTIGTTVSLSGNSSGYVVLEIAATNSSTAGDWVEISRVTSGQSGSLVIGLVLNQVGGGSLAGVVPPGYYVRLRSVNSAGTPTYTMNGQQEAY